MPRRPSDQTAATSVGVECRGFVYHIPPGWPEAVIFDLDGTLVDTAPDLAAALNVVLEGRGLAPLDLNAVEGMIGGGVAKLVERGFAARGVSLGGVDLARATEAFMNRYSAHASVHSVLYPWAEDALKYLTRHAIGIGLCTNKPTEVSRRILMDFGLLAYFDADVGGTSGYPKKPDPASLEALVTELGVFPGTAVVVGDSATDVATARAAGMPVIAVAYGYSTQPVEQLGADAVIDALSDLPQALTVLRRQATALSSGDSTETTNRRAALAEGGVSSLARRT